VAFNQVLEELVDVFILACKHISVCPGLF